MKVLVTGGSGFIGRHLVHKLRELEHEVNVLDTANWENPPEGVNFVKGDIRDESELARASRECGCVFHLAAMTDVRNEDENADYEINFMGSKKVFEMAKKRSAKVVFASTAAVYGDIHVCKEDMECKPKSQYGKSKLKAENILLRELPESFIARQFNVYGPGGKGVVNTFCKKVPKYEQIRVFGNGMQTRDYIYVQDVVDALILGMDNSGVFNVGTGTESSLLQVLDTITEITKAKPDYKFEYANEKDIKQSRADISKISEELGWRPKINLKQGILETLKAEGWKPLPS